MSSSLLDSDVTLAGCSNNRSLRHAVVKNAVEQTACDTAQRTLNAQQKSLTSKLSKEERGLRAQLERLQLQQRGSSVLTSLDKTAEDYDSNDTDTPAETPDYRTNTRRFSLADSVLPEDDVINPYPISVRQSKTSEDNSNSGSAASGGSCSDSTGLWAGDPEAIQSVRRGQKPFSLRRFDPSGPMSRSFSMKERPASSRGESDRRPSGDSTVASPGCSRAGSVKGRLLRSQTESSQASMKRLAWRSSNLSSSKVGESMESSGSMSNLVEEGEEKRETGGRLPHRRTKSLKYCKSSKIIE